MDIKLSIHAQDILKERNILEDWVWKTIQEPGWQKIDEENNVHYFRKIIEYKNRVLHVVLNPNVSPQKVVTVFFDRRERNKK